MDDGKEIDAYKFSNHTLAQDLQEAFMAVEARLEDLERIQVLQLGPISKVNLDRYDIENALADLAAREGLWKDQGGRTWCYSGTSTNSVYVKLPDQYTETTRPAFWERQFLMIAACEGVTPAQLYDDLWPDRRDVVTRLSEVPGD